MKNNVYSKLYQVHKPDIILLNPVVSRTESKYVLNNNQSNRYILNSYTLNTDKSLDSYGQNYKSYSDINAGQISYYVNKDSENIFNRQFTKNIIYQDPMGSMKPSYNSVLEKQSCEKDDCFSFIKDTQFHREDIISLQMRRSNQERFIPK